MSMNASLHNPTKAKANEWPMEGGLEAYASVCVEDNNYNRIAIFLPAGAAQSVADAINAAVANGKGDQA